MGIGSCYKLIVETSLISIKYKEPKKIHLGSREVKQCKEVDEVSVLLTKLRKEEFR